MLVHNDLIRANPEPHFQAIANAFKAYEWTVDDAREELSKVHLSNLPENLAFFRGAIDEAGSFASVFQTANLAYGSELQPSPVSASFSRTSPPSKPSKPQAGSQPRSPPSSRSKPPTRPPSSRTRCSPATSASTSCPTAPTSTWRNTENHEFLTNVNHLLGVSPGSMILLRGHVDDMQKETFRNSGGEALLRKMALKAIELSNQRAEEVKRRIIEKYPPSPPTASKSSAAAGRNPPGKNPDLNRRVEVQWFTVE
jgi:NitT/TauT family transport system substrate-binding protein